MAFIPAPTEDDLILAFNAAQATLNRAKNVLLVARTEARAAFSLPDSDATVINAMLATAQAQAFSMVKTALGHLVTGYGGDVAAVVAAMPVPGTDFAYCKMYKAKKISQFVPMDWQSDGTHHGIVPNLSLDVEKMFGKTDGAGGFSQGEFHNNEEILVVASNAVVSNGGAAGALKGQTIQLRTIPTAPFSDEALDTDGRLFIEEPNDFDASWVATTFGDAKGNDTDFEIRKTLVKV